MYIYINKNLFDKNLFDKNLFTKNLPYKSIYQYQKPHNQ
jgi:hypothetical protein